MIFARMQLVACRMARPIRQPRPPNPVPKVLALAPKGFRGGLGENESPSKD